MRAMNLPRCLLALTVALAAACDDTPEAAPSDSGPIARDVVDVTDVASDTGSDVVTPQDAAGDVAVDVSRDVGPDVTADAGTDVAADASPDVTGDASPDVTADASPDVVDASCAPGDGGCFACPTTSSEIINRCTAASCARFDNAARLPRLLADGGLPPLP